MRLRRAGRLVLTVFIIFWTGTWFGEFSDRRLLVGIGAFALLSLTWLWLASRAQHRPATINIKGGVASALHSFDA
jgi:hypothetical protein